MKPDVLKFIVLAASSAPVSNNVELRLKSEALSALADLLEEQQKEAPPKDSLEIT